MRHLWLVLMACLATAVFAESSPGAGVSIPKEDFVLKPEPPLSGTGYAKLYFSSATNTPLYSANGGAYIPIGGGGGGGGHTIQEEGTSLPARANLNFIGAGVVATDNIGANSTDVTIAGGGGSQTPWTSNINAAGYILYGNSTVSGNLTLDSTSDAAKGDILLNPAGGNVGIGTETPRTKLELGGDGAILATGTIDEGWTEPNLGAGTRLMWYPRKAAFRAGEANEEWNDVNIGRWSTAMGRETTASGALSTAMGRETTASGALSTAMGFSTTASGAFSTAMGLSTTASGTNSMAMGYFTTASGAYSTAMGHGTTAHPFAATALGRFNLISGDPHTWVATDPLFIIGNGADDANRNNALTVLKNGNTGIGTPTPGSALDVKGTLRLSGATSGYVGLAPAADAGVTTYTLPAADGTVGQLLSTSGAGILSWATAGGGGGEANTASNIGVGGIGFYSQKVGVDLQFKNINAASTKVAVTNDVANNEVDIDVVEANINHDALLNYSANRHFLQSEIDHATILNIGVNAHSVIDTHLANTANPHSTSDANLVTTDITTNNVSITKHGFAPKGTNVGNFLRDDGTWAAVGGGSQTPWTSNINAAGYTLNGNSTANGNLTLDSTSDATKGNILLNPTGGNVGIKNNAPSASLSIGDGGTTAALGLNFGDTAANLYRSAAEQIKTDATAFFVKLLQITQGGITQTNSSSGILLQGNFNQANAAGYDIAIANRGDPMIWTSGIGGALSLYPAFAPTSGTGVWNGISLTSTINQTGGASGITRGLYIAPTITAAANFRAIETTVGNVILGSTSGNVGIGTATPNNKLQVAGMLRCDSVAPFQTRLGESAGGTGTGGDVTAVGFNAGLALTSGGNNSLFGTNAGRSLTWSSSNTLIGASAGYSITTGGNNVGIGTLALGDATNSGSYNVAVGRLALAKNTTANYNVAIGDSALNANTSGVNNTAVGYRAGVTGSGADFIDNTFLGYQSGTAVTSGARNTFIGSQSGFAITTGQQNVFVGTLAGASSQTGSGNVALGFSAGRNGTLGTDNTLLGRNAGNSLSNTANNNVIIGSLTGSSISSGGNNIILGTFAGSTLTTGSNNILIGYNINAPVATASNQMSIGNLIFATGVNGVGLGISTGNVGIGTSAPAATARLDVVSVTQGVLLPRMTTVQKNAIETPAEGLMVYDLTLRKLCVFTTVWETITSAP